MVNYHACRLSPPTAVGHWMGEIYKSPLVHVLGKQKISRVVRLFFYLIVNI